MVGFAGFGQLSLLTESVPVAFGHPMNAPLLNQRQQPPAQFGVPTSMPPVLRDGGSYIIAWPSAQAKKD
eukprot:CAMPEP_0169212524 /NCGR_PEP_ID=MMETSP1016-20121227/16327_1 /TAXON_ID=342587 /ORGANISM="Karlodinium micrum, Strain CCMP2283" /LENGTH=68 /DNA_ID=CAMNT_0009290203 /DNA_START=1390 /DNA_END=1596 /DNA_ORIENTATION=-